MPVLPEGPVCAARAYDPLDRDARDRALSVGASGQGTMTESPSPARSIDPQAVAAGEALRASYRPDRVTTLFVGESATQSARVFEPILRYVGRSGERARGDSG
jgi:hypothetical protein